MDSDPHTRVPDSGAPDVDETPLTRWERTGLRVWQLCLSWLWPAAYGGVWAGSAWWLWHSSLHKALADNRLSPEFRTSATLWVLAGSALMVLGYALLHALARWRDKRSGVEVGRVVLTRRLNLALAPSLALPALLALGRKQIETDRPQLSVGLAVFVGVCFALIFFRAQWPLGARWASLNQRLPNALRTAGAWFAVAALWVGYGVFFSRLSITNHHALQTATFDLGLYDNIFYQSLHGRPLGCSFLANNYHGAAHFDPILVLLAPLYALYPRAELLLILQSFWLGSGVIPLYLLARRRLGARRWAVVFSSLWLLYPALHGANLYDFHSLSLVAPVLVGLFWCWDAELRWGYWLMVLLALSIREDVPLLLCFIAFGMIATRSAFGVRNGWLTVVVSLAYFVCVKAFLMGAPEKALTGTQTYSFAYYYSDLIPGGKGVTELVQSLLTNPAYVLQLMSTADKLSFVLLLFVPLGFLPLWSTRGKGALLYGLPFCLLATREPVFSIYFQYATVIYGVLFPLAVWGSQRCVAWGSRHFALEAARLQRALIAGLWFTSLILSLKFGGWVANTAFRGGFAAPDRELDARQRERYAWVDQTARSIPKAASVGSTRRMGPHISNRSKAHGYPSQELHDYLFLDESQLDPKQSRAHKDHLERGDYSEVTRFDRLVLYRRGAP